MKYFLKLLPIFLLSQVCCAGGSQSVEVGYLGMREPYASLEDFKDQVKEITQIQDLHEFEVRWTGLVNRANSEPWNSRLRSLKVDPERLFDYCDVRVNEAGQKYCNGIIAYACPTDTTSNNHEKQIERCGREKGAARDKCVAAADRAFDHAMTACVAAEVGSAALGATRTGQCNCGGNAGCGH